VLLACSSALRAQEDLDRVALVDGLVVGGGLIERHVEVEDLAGVDLAIPDQLVPSPPSVRIACEMISLR
jgi:hypothetical protein